MHDDDDEPDDGIFMIGPSEEGGGRGQLQAMLGEDGAEAYLEQQQAASDAHVAFLASETDRRDAQSELMTSATRVLKALPYLGVAVLVRWLTVN